MKSNKIYFLLLLASVIINTSCNKILDFEPDPRDRVVFSDTINTPEGLQELLVSCYDVSTNAYYGNQQNVDELLSDNLNPPNSNNDYNEVYIRNTIFFNTTVGNFYQEPYIAIFRANVLLERMNTIPGLTSQDSIRMTAESRFMRGFNHFEIVNLFAQPFVPNSDNSQLGIVIKENTTFDPLPRSSVGQVYDFILQDLLYAEENLPVDNGIFANKWAADAMLARVYFQMNDFENAAHFASLVIDNGPFSIGANYDRWSQGVSSENIFTLFVEQSDGRTNLFANYRSDVVEVPTLVAFEDYYFELYGNGPLANPNDKRKDWFEIRLPATPVEFYACTKFNMDFFNIPYLHLTEMLLIRSESLAEMGNNLGTAISDINQLRTRAEIALLDAGTPADGIIEAARTERKKEMFGEGRWVNDLKRRGALGEDIMVRGVPYDCNGMILQFPVSENTSNFIMNPSGGCN